MALQNRDGCPCNGDPLLTQGALPSPVLLRLTGTAGAAPAGAGQRGSVRGGAFPSHKHISSSSRPLQEQSCEFSSLS